VKGADVTAQLAEVPAQAEERWACVTRESRKGKESKSVENQGLSVEDEAAERGAVVVGTFPEPNVSGGRDLDHRPQFEAAVPLLERREANVLVFDSFDRWHRYMPVQWEVMGRVKAVGGRIYALDYGWVTDETAAEWQRMTTAGTNAEFYRRVTREKTMKANRRNVRRGVFPGPLPFFARQGEGKVAEHNAAKVKLMRQAIRMRLEGATIRECRAYLNGHGVEISYRGVQSAFTSKLLVGRIEYGGEVNLESFPPVIDPEMFGRLQKVRVTRGRRSKSDRLLARLRILRCGTCGTLLQVGTSKTSYPTYKCSNADCARRVSISAPVAEREVSEFARARLKGLRGKSSKRAGLRKAQRELEQATERLDSLVEMLDGSEDVGKTREKLAAARADRDAKAARVEQLRRAFGEEVTLDAFRNWDEITLAGRRDLISAVVASATVAPGRGDDRITIGPFSE
jgi:DNA invertase Pin-like site-specific DNA recombinase